MSLENACASSKMGEVITSFRFASIMLQKHRLEKADSTQKQIGILKNAHIQVEHEYWEHLLYFI